MTVPSVIEQRLIFGVDDPERAYVHVALDCDDAVLGPRRFRQTRSGWLLAIPRPDLARLEYRLALTTRDGHTEVVCDPDNPERVDTPFGERSVALMPGYERPAWLSLPREPGEWVESEHADDRLDDPIPLSLWEPVDLNAPDPAPMLVVNDGPEYAELSQLIDYAGAMISAGTLPPFRVLLVQPVQRDEWYAASADFIAAAIAAVDDVRAKHTTTDNLVVMGASLGGLSAVLSALSAEGLFVGAFSQSGSFFEPTLDPQESSYPYFERVTSAVQLIRDEAATVPPLMFALTCGATEENHANNLAMRDALLAAGHAVTYRDVPDLHNFTAWRDSLDPALTDLLRAAWGAQG